MAKLDPVTGPVPREEFAQAVAAPAGEAAKILRRYDPFFGKAAGEKITWKVRVRRSGYDKGTAYVEAASEKEAGELVDDLDDDEIDWDYGGEGFEVVSVHPHVERKK